MRAAYHPGGGLKSYNKTTSSHPLVLITITNQSFFFLSYSNFFLLNHCRCSWLLLNLITLNDTHTHIWHDIHNWLTSMSPAGYRRATPAIQRPETYAPRGDKDRSQNKLVFSVYVRVAASVPRNDKIRCGSSDDGTMDLELPHFWTLIHRIGRFGLAASRQQ